MTDIPAKKNKVVGILGGMGPDATVDLMSRVIAATPASDDLDHIHMLVDNNPKVPSRIKALIDKTGESPGPVLAEMARGLVASGADFLAMPCNTAHYYYADIEQAVDVPVLHLIELVFQRVTEAISNIKTVGMLASTAVQLTRLYDQQFASKDIEVYFPDQQNQARIMELIKSVKRDAADQTHLNALSESADVLQQLGVDCLIIACTELSVVSEHLDTELPVFDASQLLAEEIVKQAK